MSDLSKRSSRAARGPGSHEDGGGAHESRPTPVALLFAMLALLACCGLPVLIVAAGGLASLSVIAGRYGLAFASVALFVVILVAIGIALGVRSRSTSRSPQTKTGGDDDDCCK